MRKFICLLSAVFLCFSFPFTGRAYIAKENEIDSRLDQYARRYSQIHPSFDQETGTLTISGTGTLWYFFNSPWSFSPDENVTKLVVEEGITGIYGSFKNIAALKEVILPSSLEFIYASFIDCSTLKKISFPKAPEWVSSDCFDGGKALTEIFCEGAKMDREQFKQTYFEMPYVDCSFNEATGTLTVSGFGEVSKKYPCTINDTYGEKVGWTVSKQQSDTTIQRLVIEEGIVMLDNCFNYLLELKEIHLPNSLISISASFNGCAKITQFHFPPSVQTIVASCGSCPLLEKIEFSGPVEIGSDSTFSCFDSDLLRTLYIPDGSVIHESAFSFPNIQTVIIGGPNVVFAEPFVDFGSHGILNTNRKTTVYCYEPHQKAFAYPGYSGEDLTEKGYDIHLLADDERVTFESLGIDTSVPIDIPAATDPTEGTTAENKKHSSEPETPSSKKPPINRKLFIYVGGGILLAGALLCCVVLFIKKKR